MAQEKEKEYFPHEIAWFSDEWPMLRFLEILRQVFPEEEFDWDFSCTTGDCWFIVVYDVDLYKNIELSAWVRGFKMGESYAVAALKGEIVW